jgi:hypothetical protein
MLPLEKTYQFILIGVAGKRIGGQKDILTNGTMYNFYIEASGQIGGGVIVYLNCKVLCSLVRIVTPHPLSRKQVCPSPLNKWGGGKLACGRGGGGVPIPTTEEEA